MKRREFITLLGGVATRRAGAAGGHTGDRLHEQPVAGGLRAPA